MQVIVVGAGLGGLASALALARAGIHATVVEQAAAFGEAGAGIQLSPNATRALFALGLEDAVRAVAAEPEAAEVRDHRSRRILLRNPLGTAAAARWGASYWQVHRADLHALLLAAVEKEGRTRFRLAARVQAIDGGGVTLGDGTRLVGDAVIGCDGVRSVVRQALWGEGEARFTGQVAWRGVVPADRLQPGLIQPVAAVWTGQGRHFVHYPVRGGALVNFIAVTQEKDWRVESWSEPGDRSLLAVQFADWPPSVRALIAETETPLRWALFDRPPLARWSKGNATLLGDAAHPMLPFLAQGAAMAMEDAVVLARCLEDKAGEGEGIDRALARYEHARRARTAKVQGWSRRNAALFHLPAAAAAAAFGAAGMVDRIKPGGGAARFDWLYGYDAARAPV